MKTHLIFPYRFIGKALGSFVFLVVVLFSLPGTPIISPFNSPHSQVLLISPFKAVKKGEKIPLGFFFHLNPGWHTYWSYEGETGKPLKVTWEPPEGSKVTPLPWPVPHRYENLIGENKKAYSFIYEREVLIPFLLQIPENHEKNNITLKAHLEWLLCKDVCLSQEKNLSLSLKIQDKPLVSKETQKLFHKWKDRSPLKTVMESDFKRKGLKNIIHFKNPKACIDIYPHQPEDFSPAPPTLIKKKTGCAFEVLPGSSKLPQISGLLLYKTNEGKVRGANFVSREKAPFSLLFFALLAFIGGLILNIMPCVLPVIFLKLYNTLELKGQTARSFLSLNLSYTAGVISSFLALAFFIFISKTAGESIGWGFHLQSPVFVTLLALLFLIMGFYLLGWISLPLPRTSLNFKDEKPLSHFLTGILSTTAASPCTVPFMASAVGFAFSRSYMEIFVIFFFLGLGLSFPYLLLSFFPGLLSHLPGPGKWMERLKVFFAFPLFATVLWLFYLLFFQLNKKTFLITVILLLLAVLSLLAQKLFKNRGFKYVFLTFLIGMGTTVIFQKTEQSSPVQKKAPYPESLNVKSFSPNDIFTERQKGKNIFIAFGAEWCLTCKFNERIFHKKPVTDFFKTHSIQFYYGDWTNKNPVITKFLEKYGYKGVPFYIFFKGSERVVIFSSFLTLSSFLKKLQLAFKKSE